MKEQNLGSKFLGYVIRIISNTELIIDVGDDYLTVGDKVIVYAMGEEVLDLEGRNLGPFEYDKVTLVVKITTPTYSVCETIKNVKEVSAFSGAISQLTRKITEQDTLKVDTKSIEEIKIENKNLILKGDLVKRA